MGTSTVSTHEPQLFTAYVPAQFPAQSTKSVHEPSSTMAPGL